MAQKSVYRIHQKSGLLAACAQIEKLLNGEMLVLEVRTESERRRVKANRRYWAILEEIADQTQFTSDQLHEWFKRKFIGVREVKLPDGETLNLGLSSAELSVKEFTDYMTSVEAYAVTEMGIIFNELHDSFGDV